MAEVGTANAVEIPDEIRALSFEEAMGQLEQIVQQLESGQVGLEQSIEIYSRGTLLRRHCEGKLRAAQLQVERIVVGTNGSVASEPMQFD